MRKFAIVGLVAVAGLALAACKSTSNAGSAGAVSGQCSTKEGCCGKCDKAAMGAVSGTKSDCSKSCGGDKGSMGAVSGKSESCAKACGAAKSN
jgi:hypothetical protein